MERLTGHAFKLLDNGKYCAVDKAYTLNGTYGDLCETICHERESCKGCPIQEATNRLAAYEDTGMMPEEITAREEKVKQAFRERMNRRNKDLNDPACENVKIIIASMMNEITELYAEIFDISFDEAAKALHGGDHEQT